MRNKAMEKRIVELEMRFMHQQSTIQELNEVVITHQQYIDELKAEVGRLKRQMGAEAESSYSASLHRIDEFSQAVTPIDPLKRFVMHRFQPEFQPDVGVARDIGDEIQDVIGHAVGTSGDGKADDTRKVESLSVKLL